MGGVARQEDTARPVPFGHPLRGVPRRLARDLDVEPRRADRPADVLGAPLVGEVLQCLAELGLPRRVEHPALLVVHGQQRPVRVRARQIADDETPFADHRGQVPGPEGDAHVVEQVPGTRLPDPQLLPDRTARPVRRHEVVGAHRGVLPGLPVLHHGAHPVRVLVEAEQFRGEPQIAALGARMLDQHRLQIVLAAQTPAARTEPGQPAAGVDLLEQPLLVVPGERGRLQDAVVLRQHRSGVPDQPLRPGRPEELHRADVVAAPPRVGGGARVLLDEEVADAEPAQEEGGGQAHQGAAHDEDRYAVVDVLVHQLLQLGRRTYAVSMPSYEGFGDLLT